MTESEIVRIISAGQAYEESPMASGAETMEQVVNTAGVFSENELDSDPEADIETPKPAVPPLYTDFLRFRSLVCTHVATTRY